MLPRLRHEESGQILILGAVLFMFVIIGAAALAIDVGSLQDGRDSLRGVADASSFAGARKLTSGSTAATGTCSPMPNQTAQPAGYAACNAANTNLASLNLTNPQISWQTGYNSVPTAMHVTVTARAPALFAGIFGVLSTAIRVDSAATVQPGSGGTPAALFAYDPSCSGLGIKDATNGATVNGAVISNGKFLGNDKSTYKGTVEYNATCGTPKGTFLGTPPTQTITTPLNYPRTWDAAAICATAGATNRTTAITITNASADGIYCSTVSITVTSNTAQSLTIIAPMILINGSHGQNLSPFTQNLLAYQNNTCGSPPCTPALSLTTNNVDWTGDIYAPQAEVDVGTNAFSTNFIEAYDIWITTNGFSVTGDGPTVGASSATIAYSG